MASLYSLNSIKLGTEIDFKITDSILSLFTSAFLINSIGASFFGTTLTSIPNELSTVEVSITNQATWGSALPDDGTFACYYYPNNPDGVLVSGDQLGFRYIGSGMEFVTFTGFENDASGFNYFLFALDQVATKNVYFNFYDTSGNSLNRAMKYVTDPFTNSVACSFPDSQGVYVVQVPYFPNLKTVVMEFIGVMGFSYGVAPVGVLGSPNNYTSSSFPCFLDGTMILGPNGEINISVLKAGDIIFDGKRNIAIIDHVWSKDIVFLSPKDSIKALPILIPQNYLGTNKPNRDTYISPFHKIMAYGELTNSIELPLPQQNMELPFKYYNLSLQNGYRTMIANNCVTETYTVPKNANPNPMNIHN